MDKTETSTTLRKELSFNEKVIKKIAGLATDEVPGVLTATGGFIGGLTDRVRSADTTKGIDADVGKQQVALDLNVICEYGKNVPLIFDMVGEKVAKALKDMTGLDLVELNMHVDDVLRKDEFNDLHTKMTADRAETKDYTVTSPQKEPEQRVQ